GEIAGSYRLAGDLQPPLLPLLGELGWLVGGEQVIPAQRTAPVLPGEQAKGISVQRRLDPLPPFGPVCGQGGVIGRCRALDRHVPYDAGPGELDQAGAAVAVAEHPVVIPELVELAEVPADDPALRLVRVAPCGPLVGEFPHVVIQGGERPGRHHAPVVGRPAPVLRALRRSPDPRVRAAQRLIERMLATVTGVAQHPGPACHRCFAVVLSWAMSSRFAARAAARSSPCSSSWSRRSMICCPIWLIFWTRAFSLTARSWAASRSACRDARVTAGPGPPPAGGGPASRAWIFSRRSRCR